MWRFGCQLRTGRLTLSKMLKIDGTVDGRIDGLCDSAEDVESDIGSSCFDFSQMGSARARHERNLALGYAAGLPLMSDDLSQALFLGYVVHATSVGVGYSKTVRYREQTPCFKYVV